MSIFMQGIPTVEQSTFESPRICLGFRVHFENLRNLIAVFQ